MALLLLKYALFGVVPLVIPSVMLIVPLAHRSDSQPAGHRPQYIRYLAEQAGYVFYIDPGPVPGVSKAYWGPQIKVGPVQPALSVDMDAYTNVESLQLHLRPGEEQDSAGLHLQLADRRQHSDSDAADHAAESAAGPDSAAAHQPVAADLTPFRDDLAKRPIPQAIMMGLAQAAQNAEAVTVRGKPRCDALRRRPEGAATGGRARRGPGVRRPVLREERDPQDQARRVQAGFHTDPQRFGFDGADGEPMSYSRCFGGRQSATFLRQVPRAGDREHRSASRSAA